MFNVNFDQFYQSLLFHQFGRDIKLKKFQFIGGGCINNTVKLFTGEGEFFLKWNEFADDDIVRRHPAHAHPPDHDLEDDEAELQPWPMPATRRNVTYC